jgi:YcxB-like protein
VKYTIEEEEFVVSASAAYMATNPRRARSIESWSGSSVQSGLLIFLCFFGSAGYARTHGVSIWDFNWLFWGVMVLLAILLLSAPIRYRRCWRALYKTTNFSGKEFDLQHTDTGLTVEEESATSFFRWTAFRYWLETQSTFVFQLNGPNSLILPKRCFTPVELSEFRAMIASRVKQRAI